MSDDFRDALAELVAEIDTRATRARGGVTSRPAWPSLVTARALLAEAYEAEANNPPEGHPDPEPFQVILREKAAALRAASLAHPVSPPEPVGVRPSSDEIYKLALDGDFLVDVGDGFSCMVQDEVEFAYAVLARWGRAAPEPVSVEEPSEELLEKWRDTATAQSEASDYSIPASRIMALQAIDWCRQQSQVQPVSVTERLPTAQDCDADGFCWAGYPWTYDDANEKDSYCLWMFVPADDMQMACSWLPHWALPVPLPTTEQ